MIPGQKIRYVQRKDGATWRQIDSSRRGSRTVTCLTTPRAFGKASMSSLPGSNQVNQTLRKRRLEPIRELQVKVATTAQDSAGSTHRRRRLARCLHDRTSGFLSQASGSMIYILMFRQLYNLVLSRVSWPVCDVVSSVMGKVDGRK